MNRYWKSGILCAVLLGSNTNAADSNSSLLDYVSPSADTVVYVNTRQAEKAMTPDRAFQHSRTGSRRRRKSLHQLSLSVPLFFGRSCGHHRRSRERHRKASQSE